MAADIVDIRWSPQGRFEHRAEIAPGRFAEPCGALPPGTEVRWSFEGSAPLDFDVHWHEDEKAVMPTGAPLARARRRQGTAAEPAMPGRWQCPPGGRRLRRSGGG